MFKKIAIIGGGGKMGSWFAKFFKKEGIEVFVSDKNKEKLKKLKKEVKVSLEKSNIEAVKKANFILISILLQDFEKVIREIAPYINENQIVMDITSLKEIPVKIMHKLFKRNLVLGTHPLFGPGAENTNQNFILTPTNKKEKIFAKKFKNWLENRGFKVIIMSPKKHDELMSVVLGFSHFVGLSVGSALSDLNLKELEKVAGPSFKKLLNLVKNVAFSDPKFYSELHLNLPKINKIEDSFKKEVRAWREIVRNKNRKKFIQKMSKIRKCFIE